MKPVSLFFFASTFVAASFAAPMNANKSALKIQKKSKLESRTPAQEAPASQSIAALSQSSALLENTALSSYAFQPAAGQSYVMITPKHSSVSTGYKAEGQKNTSNTTAKSNLLSLQYGRSFSNEWSLKAETAFGDTKTSSEGRQDALNTGLTDLSLTMQKVSPTQNGQLFFGGKINLSLGESKASYEAANNKKDDSVTGNLYSGGHSFSPFIGLQRQKNNIIYGFKSSLELMLEKRSTTARKAGDIESSQNGGNIIALEGFFEMPRPQFLLGFKGGLSLVSAIDYSSTDKSSGAKFKGSQNAGQIVNLGAYSQVRYNPKVDIIPSLNFNNLMSSTGGNLSLESSNEVNISVGARIAL